MASRGGNKSHNHSIIASGASASVGVGRHKSPSPSPPQQPLSHSDSNSSHSLLGSNTTPSNMGNLLGQMRASGSGGGGGGTTVDASRRVPVDDSSPSPSPSRSSDANGSGETGSSESDAPVHSSGRGSPSLSPSSPWASPDGTGAAVPGAAAMQGGGSGGGRLFSAGGNNVDDEGHAMPPLPPPTAAMAGAPAPRRGSGSGGPINSAALRQARSDSGEDNDSSDAATTTSASNSSSSTDGGGGGGAALAMRGSGGRVPAVGGGGGGSSGRRFSPHRRPAGQSPPPPPPPAAGDGRQGGGSSRRQGAKSPSPQQLHHVSSAHSRAAASGGSSSNSSSSSQSWPRAGSGDFYSIQSPSPDTVIDPSAGANDIVEPSSGGRGRSPAPLMTSPAGGGAGEVGGRRQRSEASPSVPMPALQLPSLSTATMTTSTSSSNAAAGLASITPSPSPSIHMGGLNTTTSGGSTSHLFGSSLSLSPRSSGGGGGSGSASTNPRRSLNPAFLPLSPIADSDDGHGGGGGGGGGSESPSIHAALIRLETDKAGPVEAVECDLSSLEDRRMFVTQQCAELARKMTPGRIIESLLPALLTAFECDDYSESFDNCTPSIARVLPDVIASLDDRSTDRIKFFMGLIMELCCSAESTVLRETTSSLERILALLDDTVVADLFLPLVLSMRVSYWSGPRAVAAGLLSLLAARPAVVRESRMTIAMWFGCFVWSGRDPCVLVREAAVKSLHHWIDTADAHRVPYVEMPLPLVKEFVTDDLSDAVRYLLVEELVRLARRMGREATTKHLQGLYTTACGDPSWRVRYVAAQSMGDLIGLVARPEIFLRVLALLAEDEEPEIRAAVARQIPQVVEHLPSSESVELKCVPVALRLGADADPVVRASAVFGFASLLVLESEAVAKTVCEGIARLMEDGSFAVQVEAIRSLEHVIAVLEGAIAHADSVAAEAEAAAATTATAGSVGGSSTPVDELSSSSNTRDSKSSRSAGNNRRNHNSSSNSNANATSNHHHSHSSSSHHRGSSNKGLSPLAARHRATLVVQSFVERLERMSDAGNWRLRDAAVSTLRFFCRAIREDRFAPLTHVVRVLLRDPVSEVRSRAVETLRVVAEHYGAEWAAQVTAVLLHEEFAPSQQQAYVWRLMAIQCLAVLLPVVNGLAVADLRRQQLLNITTELLQQYAADPVPNVRIALARAMPPWRAWFAASGREQGLFNAAVARLQGDGDTDVARAATAIRPIACEDVSSGSTAASRSASMVANGRAGSGLCGGEEGGTARNPATPQSGQFNTPF